MEQKVLELIARIAQVETGSLKPEQQLTADLGIDSPKALQLLCDLEEELKIEVPEEAVANIETVRDILALIPKNAGTSAAAD